MAASPRFKVYTPSGTYVAACKVPQDAAILAASYGAGATIRQGHTHIVWRQVASPRLMVKPHIYQIAEVVLRRADERDWQ